MCLCVSVSGTADNLIHLMSANPIVSHPPKSDLIRGECRGEGDGACSGAHPHPGTVTVVTAVTVGTRGEAGDSLAVIDYRPIYRCVCGYSVW